MSFNQFYIECLYIMYRILDVTPAVERIKYTEHNNSLLFTSLLLLTYHKDYDLTSSTLEPQTPSVCLRCGFFFFFFGRHTDGQRAFPLFPNLLQVLWSNRRDPNDPAFFSLTFGSSKSPSRRSSLDSVFPYFNITKIKISKARR